MTELSTYGARVHETGSLGMTWGSLLTEGGGYSGHFRQTCLVD